jgi:hypothetical protein
MKDERKADCFHFILHPSSFILSYCRNLACGSVSKLGRHREKREDFGECAEQSRDSSARPSF